MYTRPLLILISCIATSSVSYGNTSETLASLVRSGSLENIQTYLSQPGVTINDRPDNDKALLDYAAEQNQTAIATWLLDHGAAVNAAQTRFRQIGLTPLHRAAYFGSLEVARVLIAHGADVDARQTSGATPLLYAASGGHVDLVQLLLDHNADVTAKTGAGQTAVTEAAGSGHLDIVQLLEQRGAPNDNGRSLSEAASRGRVDVVRGLLSTTANPVAKDTALRLAVIMAKPKTDASYLEVISVLLDAGANVNNTVNNAPNIPLMLASRADVIELLIARGADVQATKPGQGSVLSATACNKDGADPVGIARAILKHGVDINVSTSLGTTLHCATWQHLPELQEFLLENGAKVDAIDAMGRSPVYWADTSQVLNPLLRHGASLSIRDYRGKPPLLSAILESKAPKALLLLAAGSDPNEKDSEGTDPLRAASERQLVDVVAALQVAQAKPPSKDRIIVDEKLQAAFAATANLCAVVKSFSGDAALDPLIDLTTQMTLHAFNPNDANWTSKSPRWIRLSGIIKADLAQDLKPELQRAEEESLRHCKRALFDQMPADDTERLLRFFHSAQGLRYIEFQRQVGKIQSTAILNYTNRALAGADPSEWPNLAAESKTTDTRRRLLNLSWASILSESIGNLFSPISTDLDIKASLKLMLDLPIRTSGAELDALQVTFKGELAHFEKFTQSREFAALLRSIGSAAPEKPEIERERTRLQALMLGSIRAREPAWQAAFKEQEPDPGARASNLIIERNGNMTNVRVAGSLAASHPIGCVPLEQLDGSYTPPDLFHGVSACIQQEDYRTAVGLFGLAGIESRFDAERVMDKTAGQAGQVLIMTTFDGLPEDKRAKFEAAVKSVSADPKALAHTCGTIRRIGYPTYYPEYMVLHGIRAFSTKSGDPTMEPHFDSAATWKSLLTTYLNCHDQ